MSKKRMRSTGELKKFKQKKEEKPLTLSNKEYIEKESERILNNKQTLSKIMQIIKKTSYKEETKLKTILLGAISTKVIQDKETPPVHIRIEGESSLGKTHLLRAVFNFFPINTKLMLGGLSKMALKYGKPDYYEGDIAIIDFNGKILWILEEKGGEEAYEILRPILSKDQPEIKHVWVNKDAKGRNIRQTVIFRGCPAFFTTSTAIKVMPEMSTRTFTLTPTSTNEQTKGIINRKKRKKKFLKNNELTITEEEKKIIQKIIQKLNPYQIWIPFTDLIEFSDYKNVRLRRDIDRIFALIEASTIIHQRNRFVVEFKGTTYLVAEFDDLMAALDLIQSELLDVFVGLNKPLAEYLTILKKLKEEGDFVPIKELEPEGITNARIAKSTRYSQETARNYNWALVSVGYLTIEKHKNRNYYNLLDKQSIKVLSNVINIDLVRKSMKELLNNPEMEPLSIQAEYRERVKEKSMKPLSTVNNGSDLLLVIDNIYKPFLSYAIPSNSSDFNNGSETSPNSGGLV